jgi:hypothetical protein
MVGMTDGSVSWPCVPCGGEPLAVVQQQGRGVPETAQVDAGAARDVRRPVLCRAAVRVGAEGDHLRYPPQQVRGRLDRCLGDVALVDRDDLRAGDVDPADARARNEDFRIRLSARACGGLVRVACLVGRLGILGDGRYRNGQRQGSQRRAGEQSPPAA